MGETDDPGRARFAWGAREIATEIDRSLHQTNYLLSRGILPAWKAGDKWVAEREKLRDPSRWPRVK